MFKLLTASRAGWRHVPQENSVTASRAGWRRLVIITTNCKAKVNCFWPHCTACGILVHWSGIEPGSPAVEVPKVHLLRVCRVGKALSSVLYSRLHNPQPHRYWGHERRGFRCALWDVQQCPCPLPGSPSGARVTTTKPWQSKGVQTWLGVPQKKIPISSHQSEHPWDTTHFCFSSHLQGPSTFQSEFRDALNFSTKYPHPFQPTQTSQALHLLFHHQPLDYCDTAFAAKSLQSCPTLCNSIDGSPPGSLILGFSRQEHWSRLPFPSPMRKSGSEVTQSCLTLSDPMDCSPPGSSIHGILQARVLEWGAIRARRSETTECWYTGRWQSSYGCTTGWWKAEDNGCPRAVQDSLPVGRGRWDQGAVASVGWWPGLHWRRKLERRAWASGQSWASQRLGWKKTTKRLQQG